ncbi:unnamed protein product [Adineta steineri]|uniref:G-protein coupled receptors family 1 profile domain-containing protein n=1 Tax=Adineta steineri TaxID=433720 RepID=A0A819D6E3_9BILA|nr:unnamed protein product [Adineta steineri]CAF3828358.1 unnamed protein product [Adineta steineri]
MGTVLYHSSLSSFYISNQTSTEDEYSTNNHLLHLFIFVAIWTILMITIVFGSIGNILVLYIYINRNDNKTCTFFIKMLAIVDLIICLILAPLELYQTTTGIRNEFLCKIYGFLTTHVLYSTLLITIIAFDRYFCICWPLFKIITIYRARAIVVICGLLSSLFAIIPMSEYSTKEHMLQLHNNHSQHLLFDASSDEYELPAYTHVENIKTSISDLPFTLGNITNVKCSPQFSLQTDVYLSNFLTIYRIFHSTLFAICIVLVLILYSFIYNAIYQRRRTRTKRFSTYRKILQSYLINNENDRKHSCRHSLLTNICCYCCKKIQRRSSNESIIYRSSSGNQRNRKFFQNKKSSTSKKRPEQIILEINGARGKRYSAVSMTSMTYFTSGIWDDTSSSNLIRSRINSIAATTFCGMEQSLLSRPSTSTDDSYEQTTKSKPISPNNSTYLTVPGPQITLSPSSNEINNKDNHLNESESIANISQTTNLLHPTMGRKTNNTLSIRQQQRPSDVSLLQRKVSFVPSAGVADRCIIEDPPSTNQQLTIHLNNTYSLSPPSSPISPIRNSISSTRRGSIFDGETKRIFERQQKQERLANIRTTLTLFIVTATFIVIYLPSIIITLFDIKPYEFREVLFLLYYINSACNPLIYSFFNVNFRNDIRRIYACQQRGYFARHC